MRRRIAIISIVAVVCVCLYNIDPATCWFAPKCPFKLITGLNCPACGIQRFIHTLLIGQPLQAIRYNYYLLYALLYTFLFGIAWMMPEGKYKHKLSSVIESKYAVRIYIASFMAWLVIRNLLKL